MIGKLASLKVTGSSHGSSDYQKQVVEHVLQKPFTTLEAYYDFWARMEDASKNDATFFFCVLAQKMLSADKRAATGADVALGVSGASVLGTMLQLVLPTLNALQGLDTLEAEQISLYTKLAFAYVANSVVVPGALAVLLWRKCDQAAHDGAMLAVASGFVLGEGVWSIVALALKSIAGH